MNVKFLAAVAADSEETAFIMDYILYAVAEQAPQGSKIYGDLSNAFRSAKRNPLSLEDRRRLAVEFIHRDPELGEELQDLMDHSAVADMRPHLWTKEKEEEHEAPEKNRKAS